MAVQVSFRRAILLALFAVAVVIPATASASSTGTSGGSQTSFACTGGRSVTGTGQTFTVPSGTDTFFHTLSIDSRDYGGGSTTKVYVTAVDGTGFPTGPALYTSPTIGSGGIVVHPNITVTPGVKYAWYFDQNGGTMLKLGGAAYGGGNFLLRCSDGAWESSSYDADFQADFNTGQRDSTTSVSCTAATATIGTSTTCTATVSDTSGGATPTGTVSFSTNGTGTFATSPCTLSAGTCSVTYTPTDNASGHQITASYSGSSGHLASSGTTSVTVTKRTSSTSTDCSPTPVVAGKPTTCTVTVIDTDGGTPSTPTGTITFSHSGSGSFGSGTCTLTAGTCNVTYTPSGVGTGTQTVTGSYGGDGKHLGGTGGTAVTVAVRQASADVSCAPASPVAGTATTCTATVTDSDTGTASTPGGTVAFSHTGTGALGAPTCTLVSGSCSVAYTPGAVGTGTHTVSIAYAGDTDHATSDDSTDVTVTKRDTTTTLACAPSAVTLGGATTCTATVADSGTGTSIRPGGAVRFTSSGDGTFSDTGACSLPATGELTCAVTYTPASVGAGTHTIAASYAGDPDHTSSTKTGDITVTAPPAPPPPPSQPLEPSGPVVASAFDMSPRTLGPSGGAVVFRLSRDGRVTLLVEKLVAGHERKGRCKVGGKVKKGEKRCIRYDYAGRLTVDGTTGVNRLTFTGKVSTGALPAGRYRMTVLTGAGAATSFHFRVG